MADGTLDIPELTGDIFSPDDDESGLFGKFDDGALFNSMFEPNSEVVNNLAAIKCKNGQFHGFGHVVSERDRILNLYSLSRSFQYSQSELSTLSTNLSTDINNLKKSVEVFVSAFELASEATTVLVAGLSSDDPRGKILNRTSLVVLADYARLINSPDFDILLQQSRNLVERINNLPISQYQRDNMPEYLFLKQFSDIFGDISEREHNCGVTRREILSIAKYVSNNKENFIYNGCDIQDIQVFESIVQHQPLPKPNSKPIFSLPKLPQLVPERTVPPQSPPKPVFRTVPRPTSTLPEVRKQIRELKDQREAYHMAIGTIINSFSEPGIKSISLQNTKSILDTLGLLTREAVSIDNKIDSLSRDLASLQTQTR
ncbi:MAG: hypothetical protein LBJ93_00965 [Clostridiales bacterium]|jgi:hypothetical protein|nr:hypothetical protein [Clostridiales bacterium]